MNIKKEIEAFSRNEDTNILSIYWLYQRAMEINKKMIVKKFSSPFYKKLHNKMVEMHDDTIRSVPFPIRAMTPKGGIVSSPAMQKYLQEIDHQYGMEIEDEECLIVLSHADPVYNIIETMAEEDEDAESFLQWIDSFSPNDIQSAASTSSFSTPYCYPIKDNSDMPFVGREDILARTMQILNKKIKNNVLHIGEPGVGKTACTQGLSRKIKSGDVPENLKNKTVYQLDIAGLVAGSKYRGEMEEKLTDTMHKLSEIGNIILYIDEIHTIVGAGSGSDSPLDVANILKPYLTDGSIRVIGSTTLEEYRKYIEKDKALSRRFQSLTITEPTVEEAVIMVEGLRKSFEKYYNLKIAKESINAAVELSAKYVKDRFLPDKAIDILDEAASACNIAGVKTIKKEHIMDTLSKVCRIPSEKMEKTENSKLIQLLPNLCSNVFGQNEAAKAITTCVHRSRAGLNEANKPTASILAVGPTGTGKTEMARTLANTLDVPLIKYDMSEYSDQTAVNKLIGSSAGYVGYEDGGQLIKDIRNNPYCVLLLDEIEKAHPSIYNILLQVMDDAILRDNQGNQANFQNVILIMTSNAGAATVKKSFGFNNSNDAINTSGIDEAVKNTFSPEFRNRLNAIVKFNPMNREMASKIAEKHLNKLANMLMAKGVIFSWSDDCVTAIVDKCSSLENGGREIVRIIDNEIKELFVQELLFGSLSSGGTANLIVNDNTFSIDSKTKKSTKTASAVKV